MVHLNITFPEDLKSRLDKQAKKEEIGRSTLIQKAVKVYLGLKQRSMLRELLIEGYQEMVSESKQIMEDFKDADTEAWKYVD